MDAWLVCTHPPKRHEAHLRIVSSVEEVRGDFYLNQISGHWCLCDKQARITPLKLDFSTPYYRHRGGTEYLPKAFKGMSGARIADLTAGWARDAWLLAYRGFSLTIYERNPYLAFLLDDALNNARDNPALASVADRLTLCHGDAITKIDRMFDAVYLDPMFPVQNKCAQVRKPMQTLHLLLGEAENDDTALLDTALAHARRRVAVKRRKGAPFIGERKPDYQLKAPSMRLDIYLPETGK